MTADSPSLPFCLTWHPSAHQHSGSTWDEDYWLVIADLIVLLSKRDGKRKKKKNGLAEPQQYRNHTGWHSACHPRGSISSKHNVSLLFSIWDAELVISRCAVRLWSAKESEREIEDSQHKFLPAEVLWPQVNRVKLSKLNKSLVRHVTVQCAYWKINLVWLTVITDFLFRKEKISPAL